MTVAEARKLLASDLDVFWRAYCTLAVTLGLRPGELTGLMWEDVDPEAGVIRVRHSLKRTPDGLQALDLKTEASRRTLRMPASWPGWAALRVQQAADRLALGEAYEDHGLVFCTEAGGGRNRDHVRLQFAQVCDWAGIRRFQPRETRHTYVSVRSDAGESIEDISAAVGHVNSSITKIVYWHVIRDEIATSPTAFDKILGGGQEATS
jgi:integrase